MPMQKGFRPALVLDKKGRVLAIATGSDATSEHEGGSAPLMRGLCGDAPLTAKSVAERLQAKQLTQIPDLLEGRQLLRNLDQLVWKEGTATVRGMDGVSTEPTGMLAYSTHEGEADRMADSPALALPNFSQPTDISGAWDDSGFAIRVMGKKQVAALRAFYEALQQGHGMFAGMFLKEHAGQHLSGVIICNTQLLRPEHKAAMQAAQADFEETVQLHAEARVKELYDAAPGQRAWFGYIYPIRRDTLEDGSKIVLYGLNPAYGVKTPPGVYSFEALKTWIEAGPNSGMRLSPHG